MSIECSLELEEVGNEDRVKNNIEELKKIMLQYKCPDIENVNKLVNYYITKKRYIRALVLVQCIHDVYHHQTSSLEVLGDIQIYILYMVNNIVGEQQNIIHESWKITTSLGDLLSLPSFEGVDDQKKNIDSTVCLNFLGSIFNSLGMYSKGLQNSKTAMKLAEEIESGHSKNTVLTHSFQNCLEAMDKMGHETESDMYNDKLHVTKENLKKYEKEVTEILSLELTERYLQKSKRVQLMSGVQLLGQMFSGGLYVGFNPSLLPQTTLHSAGNLFDITNPEAEISWESELAGTEQPLRESIPTYLGASGGFTSSNKDDSTSKSKLRETPEKEIKPKQIPSTQKAKKVTEARTRAEFAGNLLPEEPIEEEQQYIQNYEDEEGETENLLEEIEREIVESIKKPASIRKRIGKDGGSMELLGCSMHFPVAALKKETDIEISVDTNPENFPKDCIPVSPILHCSPSIKFNKRVTVEMELSCILQEGQQIELLCKKRGSASGWNRVESLIQEDSSIARFYLDHFCSYFASFKQLFGIPVLHKFINDVYMRKDTGLIASVFSKNRKIQMDSDLCLEGKQFKSILPLPRDIKVFKSESLNLKMISNEPKNTEVQARQSGRILVDEDFLDSRQGATREFKHCPALDKKTECNIDINYEIQKFHQDGTKYPEQINHVLDSVWPIEKKESNIIMNVKIEHNNVTAGTFVRDHGKSEFTLKDSTLDIQ